MKGNEIVIEEIRALLESRGIEHTEGDLLSIRKTIGYYAKKVMPKNWDWDKRRDWEEESLQIGYMAVLEAHDQFDPGKNVPFVVWVGEYIRLRMFEAFSSQVVVDKIDMEIKKEHRKGVLSLIGLIVMDRVITLDRIPLKLSSEEVRTLNAHLKDNGYDCRFATKKNQRPTEITVRIVNGSLFLTGDRRRYADQTCIDELAAKAILPKELISPEEKIYVDGESKSEIEWKKLGQIMDVISNADILRAYSSMTFEQRTVIRSRLGIFGAKELSRSEYAKARIRTTQRVFQIEDEAMVRLKENYWRYISLNEEAMA